jgi:hypothetical protein
MPHSLLDTAPSGAIRAGMLVALVCHAGAMWWLFGDQSIGGAWREADTQTMAINLVEEGFDLFHPRVDWRGTTDGRVESEFPLYQGLVAAALTWLGTVEWPGRLLSLASLLVTAGVLFRLAERRCGSLPAAVGTAAFLTGNQAVLLGTRIIPDGFSTALAMLGLLLFLRHLRTDSGRTLLLATVLTTLGLLTKPTAAVVVLVQMAMMIHRPPPRRARAWVAFAATGIALAAWILHARAAGLATGLTFGVTFGDTKTPGLDHLLNPGLHAGIVATTLAHGLGWPGAVALLALLLRRRTDRIDVLVLAAVAAGLIGSMRYSYSPLTGAHYHVYSALAGGWLVARAMPATPRPSLLVLIVVALLAQGITSLRNELRWRNDTMRQADLATAASLREVSAEHELVVIRGPKPRFDPWWRRPHNFEEPILLYHSRRKGWILPLDGVDPEVLSRLPAEGARWYVETAPEPSPGVLRWLEARAVEVPNRGRARLFRLLPN